MSDSIVWAATGLWLAATAGCADPIPASTKAALAAISAASEPPQAPPTRVTKTLDVPDRKPLESHRVALRARAFKRQVAVPLPVDLPAALRALIPTHAEFLGSAEAPAFKAVGWERHEGLSKVRPAPGIRMDAVHFATLDRRDTLEPGVVARLRAEGWLRADEEVHSPLSHPQHGELHLLLTEFDETPTILDFKLISKTSAPPADARERLELKAAWLPATSALPLLGYEYGRHHQYTPRASFTDLERLAFAVHAPDRAALWAQIGAAARKAGYHAVADHPRLYDLGAITLAATVPDEAPATPPGTAASNPSAAPIPPVPAGPGVLVIHHQRPFSTEPPLTPRP